MKNILFLTLMLILVAIVSAPIAVGGESAGASTHSSEAETFDDSIMYYLDETRYQGLDEADRILAKKKGFIRLFNTTSGALMDGLLVNGSLTGLGTDNPTGPKMKTESIYYQLVRIATVFDWEFQRSLNEQGSALFPGYFTAAVARFPEEFSRQFPEDDSKDWEKVKTAVQLISPDFDDIYLRQVGAGVLASQGSRGHRIVLDQKFTQALMAGVDQKLQVIGDATFDNREQDASKKAQALGFAFSPLASIMEADYTPNPKGRFMRATMFMPPLYEVETPTEQDPLTWYLRKGLDKMAIRPGPVDISIGRITDLSYLRYAQGQDLTAIDHMIKIEVEKDLEQQHTLLMGTSFGRLVANEDGSKAFSYEYPEDGMVVHWHPNLPRNRLTNAIADELEKVEIEASIQRLNLILRRSEPITPINAHNPPLYEPKYISKTVLDRRFPEISKDVEGSIIHFRARRSFSSDYKVGPLSGKQFYSILGFSCVDGAVIHCQQEFSTDDSKGDSVFAQLKNFVSKHLTRFVVGFIIPDIEAAIDEHMAEILDDVFDEFESTQNKVLSKIRQGLFGRKMPTKNDGEG